MSVTGWTPVAEPSASGWTPVNEGLDTSGLQGATIKAPPKVFSSDWFKEKADRLTDYFPGIGAAVGGTIGATAGPVGAVTGATVGGMLGEEGRQASQMALGTNFNVPQTVGSEAKQLGKEGAISGGTQLLSEGLGGLARATAPALAESALKVPAALRGRGRTIGQSVLENTSGILPKTVSDEASQQVDQLTNQMEGAVHQATVNGAMGSTTAEHQLINNAYVKIPRNAPTLKAKVAQLHDALALDQTGRTDFTPDELLEMKRGIAKELETWPPEWQRSPDITRLKMQLYGSIDGQLDQLAPGTGQLNQKISSLIPAISQGMKIENQASLVQNLAHKALAHTGALTSAIGGGYAGYHEGGGLGAVGGAAAGFLLPEVLASPGSQMMAARTLNLFSQHPVLSTAALQLLAGQVSKKQRPDHGDQSDQ